MSSTSDLLKRVAIGAAGGLAGTVIIQALLKASQKWLPSTLPPMRQDPGKFMVRKVEQALPESVRDRIPDAAENAAGQLLGLGYGVAFGAAYAVLRPNGGSPLRDGFVLGSAAWAAGYLGWLPALGLMPPVWRQRAPQAFAPAAEHFAYGLVTVAAYDWLEDRLVHA